LAETAARALLVPEVPPARAATFREVFADREFRAIWLAEFASVAGDQFARVALTVLVYERTQSPLLTALTYAVSYLPWLVGSLFLSDLADSLPRRDVMVGADLGRMLLVAAMTLPAAIVVAGSGAVGAALAVWLVLTGRQDSPVTSERGLRTV
jgi:MFS family permease